MNSAVRCAECECSPSECNKRRYFSDSQLCANCSKEEVCCCLTIHHIIKKNDRCCNEPSCENSDFLISDVNSRKIGINNRESASRKNEARTGLLSFFWYARGLYAAALGIEILCIAAAEIGENTGLYLFGFNAGGIVIAYVMGYALAGFTTFVTILGRYGNAHQSENRTTVREIDSCCSVLEQDSTRGFAPNLKTTFTNFAVGLKRLLSIHNQRGLKTILKSSLFILITAESACILTAETVGVVFYQYSVFLSVPLALLAGAFTVVAPAAYHKARHSNPNARTAE